MLESGTAYPVIGAVLGHADANTTRRYLREVSGIASDGRRLPGSAAMQAV
jgi:integrase